MPPIVPPGERALERSQALRYSNTGFTNHAAPSGGMMRDPAPYEIPEGGCYTATDLLTDVPGKLRKRGGYTSFSTGTAVVENIVGYKSGGLDGISTLFGTIGKGPGQVYLANRGSGAFTNLGATATNTTTACRPFQHRNLMVCPFQIGGTTSSDANATFFAGGATSALGTAGVTSVVTLGDNRVTSISGSPLTAAHLGGIVDIEGSAGTYRGRIVEITSSSACRVEPTPTISISGTTFFVYSIFSPGLAAPNPSTSGRFGVTYQGRIVMAYTVQTPSSLGSSYAKGYDVKPNRVIWSQLQTEPIPFGGIVADGEAVLFPYAFIGNGSSLYYNYLDIPGIPKITGLAVAGEGNLVVFGRDVTYRISGELNTETVLNPTPNYSVDQISANVGCLDARSIQYTAEGVIFCASDNVYLYDGSRMTPLLSGKNALYLQGRLHAGDVILGSSHSRGRNHYYLSLSGTDGGLQINLAGAETTLFSNMPVFDSTPDPDDPTKQWAVKWWNTSGSAPSITGGQLWALDPIYLPTSANIADGDGTNILATLESRPYADGGVTTLTRYTVLKVAYDLRYAAGTATVALSACTTLNTPDASYVSIGALPETGTTPGPKGFQILPLITKGFALQVKLAMSSPADKFEILGFVIGSQELRPGRSA